MKCLSLSNILPLPEEIINEKQDTENLVETATISLSNNQCVCPCHVHKAKTHNGRKNYRRISSISSVRIDKNDSIQEESTIVSEESKCVNKTNKKAKIIIDSSSKLPTKRESIRMLIENKAVSENKQKEALEFHFNHIKQNFSKQLN